MPLAQELLGAVIGADLAAAVAAAVGHLPDPMAAPAGPKLGVQILPGIAVAQLLPVGECLTVLHQRQVDIDLADHLGHGAAVAGGGFHLQVHCPLGSGGAGAVRAAGGPWQEFFSDFQRTPVAEDGQLLRQLAGLAGQTPLGSSYDLEGLADQLVEALEGVIDFRREASHTRRLEDVLERSSFVQDGSLRVPRVYERI